MYEKITKELMEFIEKSPSCYHVIDNFRTMLRSEGFEELEENRHWELKRGGRYFTVRADSAMIAFQVPESEFESYQIVASHSDSPSFKIKEKEEMLTDGHYVELNTERYGGMICAPWFDRPLSVAGRVLVRTGCGQIETRLVNVDRDLLMIPNVAIHMNRKVNEGYAYQAQKDMLPLFGEETAKGKFLPLIAETAGVKPEDILGTDLFLYNRVAGTIWGANREYFSSTRLDDLQCAYASVRALLAAGRQDRACIEYSGCEAGRPYTDAKEKKKAVSSCVQVCAIFDNEEVGSSTKQGADSTMLSDTLERINSALGQDEEHYRMAVASSFMLSADNAHAVHPSHLDKADPTNRPYMNHGVVIKYNANQKYTTDGISAALFKEICECAKVPYQTFANHSDLPGGSTLGNISNSHVSLNTVDIGLAQLAMHSPYETAGVKDTWYLVQAMKAFYQTQVRKNGRYYELIK